MAVLRLALEAYSYVILAAVLLSWVPSLRENPIGRAIEAVTEPVFAQIRRVIPPVSGFDLSPLLLLVALRALARML